MKQVSIIAIGIMIFVACSQQKNPELASGPDTTIVNTSTDSTIQETVPVSTTPTTTYDSASDGTELIQEKGELVYISKNEFSYVSNPYEFYLEAEVIEKLLGDEAETKAQEFEAGEDYSAYTYTTIKYRDTEISFYDYSGKHMATITTALLPLKNGVTIGMKKPDFISAMGYDGVNALKANMFRLLDDYGQMEFSFRADTLYHIYAHYEEGD